ncbi:hypothetical protein ACFQ4C_20480 [Larkinella insperata]|uniref:Uncharacterized protein n=1 Tax=Larkinella insperata TaxID=332158 RepID=A0ABW3QHY1_9BACT
MENTAQLGQTMNQIVLTPEQLLAHWLQIPPARFQQVDKALSLYEGPIIGLFST